MRRISGAVGLGRIVGVVMIAAVAVGGIGCHGVRSDAGGRAAPGAAAETTGPARPARINHIVLAKLKNPAEAQGLIEASRRSLPRIPGVTMFAAGRHLDTGRATIDSGYDVAMYIGFDTIADYLVYVDHPEHIAFVSAWKPRLEWLRVYDFTDAAYPPRDEGETAR